MLCQIPQDRPSAKECLMHIFFKEKFHKDEDILLDLHLTE